jgi:predicted nucleotidyltransferase/DNA-binding transcriptional ArsR family regulator
MPIDIEQFEDEAGLDDPTTSERIIRFLLSHTDEAYTRSEIADTIGVAPETVGTNLTRLKARGLVRHREPYWAFTDDHERARAALHNRGDDDLTDLLSESDREDSLESDRNSKDTSTSSVSSMPHREAASAFVDRARDQLSGAIEEVYIFGSVARRAETAMSDVDILVVIANEADFQAIDDRLLEIAFDIQLEYDVAIEVHSLQASEFETRRTRGEPFVRTILEEGLSV